MLRLAAFIIGVSPVFSSDDPLAPVDRGHWYHQEISREAAEAEGWGSGAVDELGGYALGVDLYCYHPVWWAYGGPDRWRGVRMGRAALGTVHFDNLDSTDEIAEIWRRILGGTIVAVEWAAQSNDVHAARQAIGVSLHAIQDFYSHSTWIDDPKRRDHTWLENLENGGAEPGSLSTGGYGEHAADAAHRHGETRLTWRSLTRLPQMLGTPLVDRVFPARAHARRSRARLEPPRRGAPRPPGVRESGPAGINLDSRWQSEIGVRTRDVSGLNADDAFDTVLALAVCESRTWLSQLNQRFADNPETGGFWDQVRRRPKSDWTEAFNDPKVLAYSFLTAGRYPPLGEHDSTGWFHRVLLTPVQQGMFGASRRWDIRSLRLRTLDSDGRELNSISVPIGKATISGPVPSKAASLELVSPFAVRARVHAFRRTAEPTLETLVDRVLTRSEFPHQILVPRDLKSEL